MQSEKINWRGIVALNAVSTLSQLGQFGVGFIVMPIWLATRGMDAIALGLFGAAGWSGMLAGLIVAPRCLRRYSSKQVVIVSLLISSVGFALMPLVAWPVWLFSSFLIGLGLGLRWIANETWLYRIAPKPILGQIVGVHEALIAAAAIVPPALVAWLSTKDNKMIMIGILFNLMALLPLINIGCVKINISASGKPKSSFFKVDAVTKIGMCIAAAGGIIDGALLALFPVFGLGRHFNETQIALLLTVIGVGAFLLQYPLGWLSDRKGVVRASLLAALVALVVSSLMLFLSMTFDILAILLFVFGGVTAAYLTFAIIAAASATDDERMAENISKVSITFTACSILGALLAGFLAAQLGSDALLWLATAASATLVLAMRGFLRHGLKSL